MYRGEIMKEQEIIKRNSSKVAGVMLDELISRQRKFNRMEKARIIWATFVFVCLAILLFFCYQFLTWHHPSIYSNLLSLINEPQMFFLLLLLVIGFIQLRYFVKKSTKAEDEFEELRKELIERNAELWEDDLLWEKREAVYSYMKDVHGINLYHN